MTLNMQRGQDKRRVEIVLPARVEGQVPEKLAPALRRFANRSVQLQREVLLNPDFRTLCEDYGDAVRALERWSNSTQAEVPQRTTEYRRLVKELEQEIQDHLTNLYDC